MGIAPAALECENSVTMLAGLVRLGVALMLAAVTMALSASPAAHGQPPPKKLPRIGYLSTGSASPWDAAFRQGLRELGYIEGKNITIEYRFAEGKYERLPGFTVELMRLNVDVIVTTGAADRAAQHATQTIPIVMAFGANVAGTPGIASLARPGGNVTGLTTISEETSGKRLALLKEAVPRLSRVAVLRNPGSPISAVLSSETEAAARALGLQVQLLEVRGPEDFERVFEAATRGRAGALLGLPDAVFFEKRARLADLAAKHRLPTIYQVREQAEAGSLMSYGPSIPDMCRRAATYVDKILKGAKPGDLPIEQPTKFQLVINLKTAKALGLTIPQSLLLQADQVIQ